MSKQCNHCHHDNPDSATFCVECGQKLNQATLLQDYHRFCQQCGSPLSPDMMFCTECGAKQPLDNQVTPVDEVEDIHISNNTSECSTVNSNVYSVDLNKKVGNDNITTSVSDNERTENSEASVDNTESITQRFCEQCGNPLDADMLFCSECGAKQPTDNQTILIDDVYLNHSKDNEVSMTSEESVSIEYESTPVMDNYEHLSSDESSIDSELTEDSSEKTENDVRNVDSVHSTNEDSIDHPADSIVLDETIESDNTTSLEEEDAFVSENEQTENIEDREDVIDSTNQRFCPNCGSLQNNDNDFCLECGYNFKAKQAPLNETKATQPSASRPQLSNIKVSKRTKWITILVAALLLLGVGGYFVSNWFTEKQIADRNEFFKNQKVDYVYQPDSEENDEVKSEEDNSEEETDTSSVNSSDIVSSVSEESDSNQENSRSANESDIDNQSATSNNDEQKTNQTQSNTDSENNSTSNTPVQTIAPNVIQTKFDSTFGNIQGNHRLYFQELGEIDGEPVMVGGTDQIRAASVIKLFTLIAYLHQVENNMIDPQEIYTLSEADKVGGSGFISSEAAGKTYTLDDLATYMITHSDNTAHNVLVSKMGGIKIIQDIINELGFNNTSIQRVMLDTEALASGKDNYVSAKDTGEALRQIYHGELISPTASQKIMTMLSNQTDKSLLGGAIAGQAKIYNKPGQYADYGVINDAGIFEVGDKAYILVVLSQDGVDGQQRSAMSSFGQQVFSAFN